MRVLLNIFQGFWLELSLQTTQKNCHAEERGPNAHVGKVSRLELEVKLGLVDSVFHLLKSALRYRELMISREMRLHSRRLSLATLKKEVSPQRFVAEIISRSYAVK